MGTLAMFYTVPRTYSHSKALPASPSCEILPAGRLLLVRRLLLEGRLLLGIVRVLPTLEGRLLLWWRLRVDFARVVRSLPRVVVRRRTHLQPLTCGAARGGRPAGAERPRAPTQSPARRGDGKEPAPACRIPKP